ncbi:uncharacterized protein [Clytia hemisphaerica]|uniref:C2H2-type domain-containing protein n=1 Tax=Clytia hemisphaerica TaxID=252671 RepID=A0A7M5XDD7_9CNID
MPRDCGYCPQKVSGCYRGHLDSNHQRKFVCGYEACFSKHTQFRGKDDLEKHQNETKKHLPNNSGVKIQICNSCSKRFTSDQAIQQHHKDKHGPDAKPTINPKNKEKASSKNLSKATVRQVTTPDMSEFKEYKQNVPKIVPFGQNHEPNKQQNSPTLVEAQSKLHEYYKTVQPTKEDRIKSRNLIRDEILKPLLKGVNKDKENLYNGPLEKAGSAATNTKVNKADEFDFDLHLNIKDIELDKSNIGYTLTTRTGIDPNVKSMKEQKIVSTTDGRLLHHGYVQITSTSAPDRLKQGDHLVPRLIHEDLFKKLKEQIEISKVKDVSIQRNPHGPAITLTYHKPGDHHIDIDLSPSLFTNDIKVDEGVWGRSFFKDNPRGVDLVDKLKEVPVLLVPKKEDCWLISHEKIMKKMFNSVDGPGTCRKECHKTLKADVLNWKSKEQFEGMSTNPIKAIRGPYDFHRMCQTCSQFRSFCVSHKKKSAVRDEMENDELL